MWKKNDPTPPASPPAPAPTTAPSEPRPPRAAAGGERSVLGSSITVRGEISGDEDLLILGQVEGDITFRKHRVTVGKGGRARADVRGKSVHVEGEVIGNLFGEDEVIIHQSGVVEGNITAPRVSLENGSQFKGSIDMGPSGQEHGAKAQGATPAGAAKPSSPNRAPDPPRKP